MQIELRNYRRIVEADLEAEGITLIVGKNEHGKTSLIEAVAAALTATPLIHAGVHKKDCNGALVNDETDGTDGYATLRNGDAGRTSITWPDCEVFTDGVPPRASLSACGLESIVDMNERERTAYLLDVLQALPTRKMLENALAGKLNPKHFDALCTELERRGWDAMWERTVGKRKEHKGAWREITGRTFKEADAAWTPDGWDDGIQSQCQTEADFTRRIEAEQSSVDAAIASSAVDAGELERLKLTGSRVATLEADVASSEGESIVAARADVEASKALDALPKPDPWENLQDCPHCGEGIHVGKDGRLHAPIQGKITPAEKKKRKAAIDAQAKIVSETSATAVETANYLSTCRAAHQDALRAQNEYEQKADDTAIDKIDPTSMRDQLEATRHQLNLHGIHHRAMAVREKVIASEALCATLAPEGLRQKVLGQSLTEFNQALLHFSEVAGFPITGLDPDTLETVYGFRPYHLISTSAQYRVRAVLQMAVSQIHGTDSLLLFDGADQLDRQGRVGLIKLLASTGTQALVAMTMNPDDPTPPLAERGIGRVYRLENGHATEVEHVTAE